ncbi:MAG: alcohol dehydrogenase catalytic domain-containing protein [Chloroflexi bacterium]|nr:alcohol dehydrogenase catalytic domain-containing protein [Chloroflexota bacterium]
MLAIGMLRDKPGVHTFEMPVPEIRQPDEVLVRVKEVGVDGTDFNMVKFNLQDIAEGRDEIAMGHEMVGLVEAVGAGVKSVAPGDVVTVTVRRGCGECHPCLHNMSDMCMTGHYRERGLHKLDGFLTQLIVEQEQYVVKVPTELKRFAVFTEPLSIVEKGVEQLRTIQSRLPWTCPHPAHGFLSPDWGQCKSALVVGAGPLGLLAIALLRLAHVNVYASDIVAEDSPKVALAQRLRAHYIDARGKTPKEVVDLCCTVGPLEIIFEASGAAATAVQLINHMSRSSIYIMTGIPREEVCIEIDAAQLVRQIVRFNQVVAGSVNSNRNHYEMALRDLGEINKRFDGVLAEMLTNRYLFDDYEQAFGPRDEKHIKTVIEVEPWE